MPIDLHASETRGGVMRASNVNDDAIQYLASHPACPRGTARVSVPDASIGAVAGTNHRLCHVLVP